MFYSWLNIGYAALLCSALWLNRFDLRMLLLSIVVGIDVFVPIPTASTASLWYMECLLIELLVILAAIQLQAAASRPVIIFSLLLVAMHLIGINVGPQPGFGPYRAAVPLFEMAELLICSLCSQPVTALVMTLFDNDLEARR